MLFKSSNNRKKYFVSIFTLSTIYYCCIYILSSTDSENSNLRQPTVNNSTVKVKKIVAYSLQKQIDQSSTTFRCQNGRIEAFHFEPVKNNLEIHLLGPAPSIRKKWMQIRDVYIYSMYIDDRLFPHYFVRFIAMIKSRPKQLSLYCQFNNQIYTKATTIDIWWPKWDENSTYPYLNPVLLSCHIPAVNLTDISNINVNLVSNPCQLKFDKTKAVNFKINNKLSPYFKRQFAVCVKPLKFHTNDSSDSWRLVQWLEMNRHLGADKLTIYIDEIPKNMRQILDFYGRKWPKFIDLIKFRYLDDLPASGKSEGIWQRRKYEILTYNDCFYRNFRHFQFVVPLDVDELIIPRQKDKWHHLAATFPPNRTSYMVPHVYYFLEKDSKTAGAEKVFFFANRVRSSQINKDGESGKSFLSTNRTLTVFNHYAMHGLLPGIADVHFVAPEVALLHHYKSHCDPIVLAQCKKYFISSRRVKDNVIWKYFDSFMKHYRLIVRDILNLTVTS